MVPVCNYPGTLFSTCIIYQGNVSIHIQSLLKDFKWKAAFTVQLILGICDTDMVGLESEHIMVI